MTVRTTYRIRLPHVLALGVALVALATARAAEPPKPADRDKGSDLERARVEVCRALEQLREAEARLRQAEKRLRELEGKAAPAAAPDEAQVETKVYALRHANAAELARVLREAFGKVRVAIAVDERTNSLVLRARRDDLAVLEALIQRLDQEAKPQPALEEVRPETVVFPLRNANAAAVRGWLLDLYGKDRAAIAVDEGNNALILRGRREHLLEIAQLLRQLDEIPSRPGKPERKGN